jgi:hypothetical protein
MRNVTKADIEEIPVDLLRSPLEWFFAEHFRQRQLCLMIDDVARRAVFDAEPINQVCAFLRRDLLLHVIDEEEDFFPLLRRRCLPEDDVEQVLGILSADHKADAVKAAKVLALLDASVAARTAPGSRPEGRATLNEFASQERQHLALENAVVLPIARLRLSEADLRALSGRLAARRGVVLQDTPR